jgi:competence protein ComEC
MSVSGALLPGLLSGCAVGILAADGGWLPAAAPLPLLVLAIGAVLVARALPVPWAAALIAALALGAAIGIWRGNVATLPAGADSVAALVGEAEWHVRGTLIEEPRPKGERSQLIVDQLTVSTDRGAWRPARGRLLVWLPRSTPLAAGDTIAFDARLERPEDFDGFAYRAYLARQSIGAIARAYQATLIGHRLDLLSEAAAASRRWLLDGLNSIVPEPEAALGAGILLGARSGISPEIGDAFARAGLTHVVAISGWNIAIVAALIAAALRPLRRRPGGTLIVPMATIGAIAAYVVLTGSTPSVVRAALMAAAMLIARLGGSRAHAASALLLAALVMLIVAPPVLWDVGFQLSLLATAGLIWFGRGMEQRLQRLPPLVREPVALTLAAQLTTLPIVLANFERLSLVAPLANVVVVPLVPLVMLCCAIAAPVGALIGLLHTPLVGDALGWLAGGSAWLYLRIMIVAGSLAASVPFASIDVTPPAWLAAAWYPALALVWLRRRVAPPPEGGIEPVPLSPAAPNRASAVATLAGGLASHLLRVRTLVALSITALASISLATLPDGRLHLFMLDVGQGDALLIESSDGHTLLVDGGPDPDVALRRLGETLPFYRHSIDVVLLTHPHQDHVAGLVEVLRRFDVRLILDSGRAFANPTYAAFLSLARNEASGRLIVARAGQRYLLGDGTSLTLLYPSAADVAAPLPDDDINNASLVGLLRFGDFTALLTGDAEAPVEARLVSRGLLGPVNVLKVGHHGSSSSTGAALLDATRPQTALISVGLGNDYGHPAAVTLRALAARPGLIVHRTDTEGTIEVSSDGSSYLTLSRVARDRMRPALPTPAFGSGATRLATIASIRAWPRWDSTTRDGCSPPSTFRTASWCIPRASRRSRPRLRSWSSRRASRSMSGSSRSPPCCTTSTSRRRVTIPTSMGGRQRDA